jgi:hypothetical protein
MKFSSIAATGQHVWQINELVVPLPRVKLLAVISDGRPNDKVP